MPATQFRVVHGGRYRSAPERYKEDVEKLVGEPRVWVVLSHIYDWGPVNEGALILQHLERRGKRVEAHPKKDGGLYLFDLGGGGEG
jgi:hypothetical protein